MPPELSVGGTTEGACFRESPPLPSSKNAQVVSLTCLSDNGALTLPAWCRSNKTNGGDGLHACVLRYDVETNPGGVVNDAVVGQERTLTQRSALTNGDDNAARQLMSSDSNTTDLLSGVTVKPISGATSSNPGVVHLTISAFDNNSDDSANAPLTSLRPGGRAGLSRPARPRALPDPAPAGLPLDRPGRCAR